MISLKFHSDLQLDVNLAFNAKTVMIAAMIDLHANFSGTAEPKGRRVSFAKLLHAVFTILRSLAACGANEGT
jgi:hypothetical protein